MAASGLAPEEREGGDDEDDDAGWEMVGPDPDNSLHDSPMTPPLTQETRVCNAC